LNRCFLIPAARFLDQIAGDPEWLPHPVRPDRFCHGAWRGGPSSAQPERVVGICIRRSLEPSCRCHHLLCNPPFIHLANRLSPAVGDTVEVLFVWNCLASRNLEQEAPSVWRRQYLRRRVGLGRTYRPRVFTSNTAESQKRHRAGLRGYATGYGLRRSSLSVRPVTRDPTVVPMIELIPLHGGQLRHISERFNIPSSQLIDFSATRCGAQRGGE